MRISLSISTSALLALTLAALPASGQEAATAADQPASNSVSAAVPAVAAHSKIRIVRLSEVKGAVELDRNTGKGFEAPMTNLPIVEGDRLKTGQGVAEVEFEDNSTVRIGQDSMVEFPKLELLPGGAKASAIHVSQGMVYVNLLNTKGNEFTMTFGKETVQLPPDSHVRLQLTAGQTELAVLHGDALVDGSAGVTTVSKNKTMTFDMANESQPQIAKNVTELPLDSWDHNAVQYHKSFANATSFGNTPYSYGVSDMNYYGSFINGCGGSMWRPYFTSASWDPYASGAWAYYPTAGYSWVSPYPWGWTPYHTGSWSFCQGVGWGWQPGGDWYGLANNGLISPQNTLRSSTGTGTVGRPKPPVGAPLATQATLVPVNMKAIPVSALSNKETFTFRGDSAGMGVPRGNLGKLGGFSGHAETHGTASTGVYYGNSQHGAESSGSSMRAGDSLPSASSPSSHSYSSSTQNSAGSGMSHGPASSAGGGGGHH